MSAAITIDVEGVRQLRRDLAAVDRSFVKELGAAYKGIGTMIDDDARRAAATVGGVAAKAAAAGAVRATARTTDVAVKLNAGPRTPFAFGAEFGGGARTTTHQFLPYRGNGPDAGYWLYPTIRGDAEKIMAAYAAAADAATAKAFPYH